jgi:hypothetical protein
MGLRDKTVKGLAFVLGVSFVFISTLMLFSVGFKALSGTVIGGIFLMYAFTGHTSVYRYLKSRDNENA